MKAKNYKIGSSCGARRYMLTVALVPAQALTPHSGPLVQALMLILGLPSSSVLVLQMSIRPAAMAAGLVFPSAI